MSNTDQSDTQPPNAAAIRGTALLSAAATEVETWLEAWPSWATLPPSLATAGRYGVLNGGKRLRPALVLSACQACGGDRTDAMPAAAAIELVHCFSLVHDDLPALDNDALRRGQPTLHVHAGEPMAILAGDLLLTQAFQLIGSAHWPAQVRADLVQLLADDTVHMVAGQVYDTLGGLPESLDPVEQLRLVHKCKTGALIRCAVIMGARVAQAEQPIIDALTDYGDAVGMMFQVVDDLLDVTQSEAHVGKAVGKDAAKGRPNWPDVLGTQASMAEVEALLETALAALAPLNANGQALADLAETMAIRTR
jgi:geranylgeranyl pyrophosphate synthase